MTTSFVCGRHKDIIIVRGADTHAPEEFESVCDELDGVRTGCAVAIGFVPEEEHDEALALLVESTSEASTTLDDEVASLIEERTGIRPAHVELLAPGTLPRTSSGKLRRREARNQWLAGTLAPPKKVSVAGLLVEAAHGELRRTASCPRDLCPPSAQEVLNPAPRTCCGRIVGGRAALREGRRPPRRTRLGLDGLRLAPDELADGVGRHVGPVALPNLFSPQPAGRVAVGRIVQYGLDG